MSQFHTPPSPVYDDDKKDDLSEPIGAPALTNEEYDPERNRFAGTAGANLASSRLPAPVQKTLNWLNSAGMESRGIERVPEDGRDEKMRKRTWQAGEVWLAANCVVPTFGIGIPGPGLFEMGLRDSIATIIVFNVFSAMLPAAAAVFGPKLGLRQMTSARYSWGWWGAKIVALLNCIACVGWSSVNTIAGAQTLRVVADEKISHAIGVVILALCTLFVGLLGYRWVHIYERFSWIPSAISFFILLGVGAKHFYSGPMPTGRAEAAEVLSFGATIFGFAVGWVSLASDYNTYFPEDVPSWKIFTWTWTGMVVPLVLVQMLGAAIMAGDAYEAEELGGLLGAVLDPLGGFGKFILVLVTLSIVANNIVNVYSFPLSLQVIGQWLVRIPQFVPVFLITAIYIPIAIVGASSFSTSLENFMNVLGYWLAIFSTVLFEEHLIFQRGDWQNYDVKQWDNPAGVPVGFAAAGAFCFGVAGAVLGMAQTWWVGPVAMAISSPYGGDVGFILAACFTGVTFPIFRFIEKRLVGR